MYSQLTKTLKEIEKDTGVFSAVFSDRGVVLSASREDNVPAFPVVGATEGAFSQGGFYFYPTKNGDKRYVIAVNDCDEAKVHATLISHAIANSLLGATSVSEADLIKLVLSGNGDSSDVKRLIEEFNRPDGNYFVMTLSSFKHHEGIQSVLTALVDSPYDVITETEAGIIAFVKHVDAGKTDVNPMEFAHSLAESVFGEAGVRLSVCVGDVVHGLNALSNSYYSALIGLKTAFRMNYTKSVFSYRDFVVVDLLASIPHKLLDVHRKTLIKPSFIATVEDQELAETAEAFFNCSLNVSETARSLFIHRNTLMYRLNKIERETGLNIRSFSDALAFRVMQMLYKTGEKDE